MSDHTATYTVTRNSLPTSNPPKQFKLGCFRSIYEIIKRGELTSSQEQELFDRYGETSAMLVLDSTGFTRSSQEKGIVYFLTLIQKLRDIASAVFDQNQAISYRSYADNLFAEFKDVETALKVAKAIHKGFEQRKIVLSKGNDFFGACIGIGYGKVLRSKNEGVFGNEMNLVSKLGEDFAERGETLLTQNAYDHLSQKPEKVSKRLINISGVDISYYAL